MNRRALSSLIALPFVVGACAETPPAAPARGPQKAVVAEESAAPGPASPNGMRLPRTALPTKYELEIGVRAKEDRFDGRVTIDLALDVPSKVVWLHGQRLRIDEAYFEIAGQKRSARVVTDERNERIGFVAAEEMPAGAARLFVRYVGEVSTNSDRGVFREEEGGDSYLFTQFENTEARSAVPCFDEPNLKTPWDVSLVVPASDVAIGNTRIMSETPLGGGLKRVRFATTRPLPSYLVAFAVGPFDLVSGGVAGVGQVPVRIAAPRGAAKEAAYAAQITADLVRVLEDYFGVPYPYDKLDAVSIPTTVTFAAMENAGLVTFFREGILAKAGEDSEGFKRRYTDIMAHELAHQWFGDLVTTSWWDDIWLNEGFATWMTTKVVAKYKPEWSTDIARVRDDEKAMLSDSLVSARRIRQPIESPDDIANAFDAITYEKGAAVLGMFESWIGEEKFRRGIHDYLVKHADGNATSRDFFAAISRHAGRDVAPAFSSFLDQPGVPLLTQSLECAKDGSAKVNISQERYLPLGSKGDPAKSWLVPVCVRSAAESLPAKATAPAGGHTAGSCGLLEQTHGDFPVAKDACAPPFVPNAGARGYYVTAYTAAALDSLLQGGARKLSPSERVALLRNVRALVAAGRLSAADALSRVASLANDPDPSVVRGALTWFDDFSPEVVSPATQPKFARFIRQSFGARAKALGFDPRPSETPETRFLRPMILGMVANRGEDPALISAAKSRARRWLGGEEGATADEVIETVLSIASAHGNRAWFDELHRAAKSTADVKRRRRLINAMASFRDQAIIEASLSLALTDEFDIREALGFLRQDPGAAPIVFPFLRRHYDEIKERLPSEVVGALPGRVQGLCSEQDSEAVEAFFKDRSAHALGGPRTLARTLEQISICSAFRSRQEPSLSAFLKTGTRATSAPGVAPTGSPAAPAATTSPSGAAGTAPAPGAASRP